MATAMFDVIKQIVERLSSTDGTALAAEAVFEDLAEKHRDDPAAAELVAAMRERNQPAVDKTWRKALAVALVQSGEFVRTSENCVAEKPMSADAWMKIGDDTALDALKSALASMPQWREQPAHVHVVKHWPQEKPRRSTGIKHAEAAAGMIGTPLATAAAAAVAKLNDTFGNAPIEDRQITFDAATGVLDATWSPERYVDMVAELARERRTRALMEFTATAWDFHKVVKANPDHRFVTVTVVRQGRPIQIVHAFGHRLGDPNMKRAAYNIRQLLPAFAIFDVSDLAAVLDRNGADLRVGQIVGRESDSVRALWDAAQKTWDDNHPQRLGDCPFWPIYGTAGWELTAFDPIAVNKEISYAVRIYAQ